MATFQLPTLLHLLLAAIFCYVIYRVHWELTTGASRRALIKEHGCEPIKRNPDYNYFPNNVIGYRTPLENVARLKGHNFLDSIRNRYLRFGNNTMMQRTIFTNLIQTIEPANLKTMLALNFKDFSLGERRTTALIPFLGPGIFNTDGAAWRHSREMLRPNFARSQVGDLTTFETHVSQLIKILPRNGATVDLQELFFQLTMDSATEFLFGESTNCLGSTASGSNMKFAECWNRSQEAVREMTRSGKLGRLLNNRAQFQKDNQFVHEYADRFVLKGLELRKNMDVEKAGDEGRYIFLHELVKQTSDPVQIRSELLNILLAGRDTTASLLSSVWFILARRPDIWQKLRMEVDALDGELPTYESIKDMKYLRALLNETLRLYPVLPGNQRTAIVDTILPLGGGPDGKSPIFIPKGQIVEYSVYVMHRRKDFYGEDAEEFKPERWETLKPGWEYLPFNGGPRICIGQQFALTEASYTTVRLMQEFSQIESRSSQPWQELLTLTCAVHPGCLVGLVPP